MSAKSGKKLIKLNKNEFIDRRVKENEKFPELIIRLDTIDSVLLLLNSEEEMVLTNALKHLMEYSRKLEENISLLKEKNLLQLLLQKEFFRSNSSILVKRLSLYLASVIIENMNCLTELDNSKLCEIVGLSLSYYLQQEDDFFCEYLSVIINKCMDDPKCIEMVLQDSMFVLKYFSTIATTSNPDVLLHSLELLLKILLVQGDEEKQHFVTLAEFPLNRLFCELNCEYFEIKKAALKVIKFLLLDSSANNILNEDNWAAVLLEQLTKMFCASLLPEELDLLIEVLAAAMDHKLRISLFFELNLFDKYLERLNDGSIDVQIVCKALLVFTECAKCVKFLPRLVTAEVTEKYLQCLPNGDDNAVFHILLGLNRLMKSAIASKRIIDYYEGSLLQKILKLLSLKEANIRTREQAATFLENLLFYAFHQTCKLVLNLNLPSIIANIFAQDPKERSVDLLLSLLNIIELMADNADYRLELCKSNLLITNMGILLKNSFSNAILVTHLFRCFGCLVDADGEVHEQLLKSFLCSSIKRALQSPSNQVKTAVTNFIMQTTRFPKLMAAFKESCILDELLLLKKHSFCVPTWQPAIESILSKNLTMKFCIRNSLGFTDTTVGSDFRVSKRKFTDFRVFRCILKEDVSPLHPVIVVNFDRPQTPEHLIIRVPGSSDKSSRHAAEKEWCYCRSPGDEFLPKFLQEVNSLLESQNLATNSTRIQTAIDFDNLAKRAKVIAQVVERALGKDLKPLDLNTSEECSDLTVKCHLRDLCQELHCCFIPLGRIHSGCKFERAILFKALADHVGLPCTLQRSVDGRILFNELPLPLEIDQDVHCDKKNLSFIPWRMLRPTHIVDLMYNVGELYPLHSRQALQYLRLF